jgi:HK97 family phage prohead protease
MDRVGDVCVKGCFSETIAKRGVKRPLLWQHWMSDPIGSIIDMQEDDKGLYVKGRLNLGTDKGEEAYALLKAQDLDTMSIGYSIKEVDYEGDIRFIKSVELWEVSLVTVPANPAAIVTQVKKMDVIRSAEKMSDIDEILREAGFSRKEADTLISRIKKFSNGQSDADPSVSGQGEPVTVTEQKQKDLLLLNLNNLITTLRG